MGINLDEARVARREEAKIHPTLTFGGKTYDLPIELPVGATKHLRSLSEATKAKDGDAITAALLGAMEAILSEDQYAEFMKFKPAIQDLARVVEGSPAEYGLEVGEAQASPKPSKSTGARSRQTSAKATA